MPQRLQRLQVMLAPNELKAIEDWRYHKRMPSRSAAVRELLRRGLSAMASPPGTANEAIPKGPRTSLQ